MATTWEILTSNSTIPDDGVNTAWDHLNAQGGSGSHIVLEDGLELEMEECKFEMELDETSFDVELNPVEYEIVIEDDEYELEVC